MIEGTHSIISGLVEYDRIMFKSIIIFFAFISYSKEILRCGKINKTLKYNFHIMQICTLSSQNVIARKTVSNLERCREFSFRLNGLAFNYADSEIITENCIVYDCPEFNVTSLKQSENPYHYYSAYAGIFRNWLYFDGMSDVRGDAIDAAENMTCLPREGIYLLSEEKRNYTEAQTKCEEYGGKLMNILTEEATIRAANVLAKSRVGKNKLAQAYVGLNDMKLEGKYMSMNDEPLNCVPFRSWAPGEPKSKLVNEDCVTIDSTRHWRVRRCNVTLPYICEIKPDGPLNLTQAYCLNIEDATIKKECSDYFTSAEIEVEKETCNRTYENLETIRERAD